jgi:hypothetical protein
MASGPLLLPYKPRIYAKDARLHQLVTGPLSSPRQRDWRKHGHQQTEKQRSGE